MQIHKYSSPGTNSLIYSSRFSSVKKQIAKLANTLRLRLLMHYSRKDPKIAGLHNHTAQ